MKEGLRFVQDSGNVTFWYKERKPDGQGFEIELHEGVPSDIVRKGEEAILAYVNRRIDEIKARLRRHEAYEDNIRKNHIPIQAKYKNETCLEGRIVEATDNFIAVELDTPLQGQSHINFGWALAVQGRYVFTADHKISKAGYDAARRALGWAYEGALHKPTTDLVERLSQITKRR